MTFHKKSCLLSTDSTQELTISSWKILQHLSSGTRTFLYTAVPVYDDIIMKIGLENDLRNEYTVYRQYLTLDKLNRSERVLGHSIHLPYIIDGGLVNDFIYLIMHRMEPGGIVVPMEDHQFTSLVSDVLSGLAYLHSEGLCHGDICDDKILKWQGHFYLTGFGLTRPADTLHVSAARSPALVGRDVHRPMQGLFFRADLENMIFCMLEWAGVKLPWGDDVIPQKIYEKKCEFFNDPEVLASHADTAQKAATILLYATHAASLGPGDRVDFQHLRGEKEPAVSPEMPVLDISPPMTISLPLVTPSPPSPPPSPPVIRSKKQRELDEEIKNMWLRFEKRLKKKQMELEKWEQRKRASLRDREVAKRFALAKLEKK